MQAEHLLALASCSNYRKADVSSCGNGRNFSRFFFVCFYFLYECMWCQIRLRIIRRDKITTASRMTFGKPLKWKLTPGASQPTDRPTDRMNETSARLHRRSSRTIQENTIRVPAVMLAHFQLAAKSFREICKPQAASCKLRFNLFFLSCPGGQPVSFRTIFLNRRGFERTHEYTWGVESRRTPANLKSLLPLPSFVVSSSWIL